MRKYVLDETAYCSDGHLNCIGHEVWTKACPYGELLHDDEPLPHCVQFGYAQKDKTEITSGSVCKHFKGFNVPHSDDFLKGVCVKCNY